MEHETEQHETEDQVSAAAIDVALPSLAAPHAGTVIDVRPVPHPPRLAPQPPPRDGLRPEPPLPVVAGEALARRPIWPNPMYTLQRTLPSRRPGDFSR